VEPVELAGLAEPVLVPDSPAWLLRADVADTPFRHRPELAELQDWCADSAWSGIRLVVGAGGQGKTRLARHLAAQLAAQGWAGLLLAETAGPEAIAVLGEVAGQRPHGANLQAGLSRRTRPVDSPGDGATSGTVSGRS
jgi:hypothetical protein